MTLFLVTLAAFVIGAIVGGVTTGSKEGALVGATLTAFLAYSAMAGAT